MATWMANHAFFTTKPMGKSIGLGWLFNLGIIVEKPDRQLKCFLEFMLGQTLL
jgi:hypothetical protein